MTNKPNPPFEGTRIDLGDDLLQETGPDSSSASATNPFPPVNPNSPPLTATGRITDEFASAQILSNEGLLDEAKKKLHQILLQDPRHVAARQLLRSIREAELQKHLQGAPERRRGKREDSAQSVDVDEVIRKLDADLGLGLDREGETSNPALLSGLSLLQDPTAMEAFKKNLNQELADASVQDWVDLGIGFLEMGLSDLAIHQFRSAVQSLAATADTEPTRWVQLHSLLAYAQILSGHPLDATLTLQAVLRESTLGDGDKLELLYLMGLAHEKLGQPNVARTWLAKVQELDPHYREFILNKKR